MSLFANLPEEPQRVPWKHRRDGTKAYSAHVGIVLEYTPASVCERMTQPESGATLAKPYCVSYREAGGGLTRRFSELRAAKRHYDVKAAELKLRSL